MIKERKHTTGENRMGLYEALLRAAEQRPEQRAFSGPGLGTEGVSYGAREARRGAGQHGGAGGGGGGGGGGAAAARRAEARHDRVD